MTQAAAFNAPTLSWTGGALVVRLRAEGVSDRLILTGAFTKNAPGSMPVLLIAGPGFAVGNTYTLVTFASTNFADEDFAATGLPAGFGAVFILTGTSLQVHIVATPVITSSLAATATYGLPFSHTLTATNEPVSFNATGLPAGLTLAPNGVIAGTPTQTGNFSVTLGATNAAGTGMATLVLTIGKAPAVVTLAGLNQSYDGTPKAVSAIAVPAGLSITISYDGQAIAPTLPGSYEVEATIADPNYSGSATGTLTITITVLVRHAPSFNAGVDGSVQVLEPENVTLNGGAFISGDLRVPGTPAVRLNGNALLVGTQDSTGSASPMNHIITLNGNMAMRYVVRRVDAIDLPTVATPQASSGTRNVSLNNSS